ncbi:MAG: hypothetical protein A3E82_04285 [Gammaproteobacteria bacterium RIFCSPHIGHO2_12_FULL_38_11]|nr:MAG: hypothetical protein A3E82_04285 [Gammaproteobacteria bacterium RIFCSPHIGHO2_12_FULL_38_11]
MTTPKTKNPETKRRPKVFADSPQPEENSVAREIRPIELLNEAVTRNSAESRNGLTDSAATPASPIAQSESSAPLPTPPNAPTALDFKKRMNGNKSAPSLFAEFDRQYGKNGQPAELAENRIAGRALI